MTVFYRKSKKLKIEEILDIYKYIEYLWKSKVFRCTVNFKYQNNEKKVQIYSIKLLLTNEL